MQSKGKPIQELLGIFIKSFQARTVFPPQCFSIRFQFLFHPKLP